MKENIIAARAGPPSFYIWEDNGYVPLDETKLSKRIRGFRDMTATAREKHFKKWLDNKAKIVCDAQITPYLSNARKKILKGRENRVPTHDDLRNGACTLLETARLFQEPDAGYLILADILCAQHTTALRRAAPSFFPSVSISSDSSELKEALKTIVLAAVPRDHWNGKNCEVDRKAVLDYTGTSTALPAHIQDFTQIKIRKGKHKIFRPFPYTDTSILVIGARASQMREAAPYIENAAVILLNSANGDLSPTRLTRSSISGYDPQIVSRIKEEAGSIAVLLRWWWEYHDDEDSWAEQIVTEARRSLGKPDSRYISVEFEPQILRNAIRYQVVLSFLDALIETIGMTPDELEPYRQGTQDVFFPSLPEQAAIRRAEDADVFLEFMQKLVSEKTDSIISEKARFVKADKPIAAWRMISGEKHLVIPEQTWSKEYSKAMRAAKGIDASFLQCTAWDRELQKLLCERGQIKAPSAGYRYRYDLYGTGKRDTTYVLAIPAKILE